MTNDWYYISWYSMWIGHLVCYGVPAALWIPSYFNDGAAQACGSHLTSMTEL